MVDFNNTLESAVKSVLKWEEKQIITETTIIRDVQGKVSLFLKSEQKATESDISNLEEILQNDLNGFFTGKIFWEKCDKKDKLRIEIIKSIIEESREEWKTEDGVDFYICERPIAKKAWVNATQDVEPVWQYQEAECSNKAKVVTFYSFKGGMGRTTALAGIALNLIEQNKNVMMIDMDIEAPGLSTLFFDDIVVEKGLLDYLIERPLNEQCDIHDYVLEVTDPALLKENDGNLYLMPAGKVDETYLQKLARIDYQDNRENNLKSSIKNLLEKLDNTYHPDYILIDARAGFHDMGGIAVAQIPHGAVLIGNGSKQSWDGMTQVIRTIAKGNTEEFSIMIVDSMCERATAERAIEQRKKFLNMAYTVCMENYYNEDQVMPGIDAEGVEHQPEYIPYDSELMRGFELFSDGYNDSEIRVQAYRDLLTGSAYKDITKRIQSWFGE